MADELPAPPTGPPSRTLKRSRHGASHTDADGERREGVGQASEGRAFPAPAAPLDRGLVTTTPSPSRDVRHPPLQLPPPSASNNGSYSTFSKGRHEGLSSHETPHRLLHPIVQHHLPTWNDQTSWTQLKASRWGGNPFCFPRRHCHGCLHCPTCETNGRVRSTSSRSSGSTSSTSVTTTTSGSSGSTIGGKSTDDDGAIVDTQTDPVATMSWKIATLLSIAIATLAILRGRPCYLYFLEGYRTPVWEWDRNVYIPAVVAGGNAHGSNGNNPGGPAPALQRFSLIAQLAADTAMRRLADVSSRPNRAYARQWKMDYTIYNAGRRAYSAKSCFDEAYVLQAIIAKQVNDTKEPPPLWSQPPRVRYSTVVLLPADAIVMDLDQNIVEQTLSREKLVAISGWVDSKRNLDASFGLVVFNLEHKYAAAVANLWWGMTQGSVETCGATNGVSTLIEAIAIVMDGESESLDDLIEPMKENIRGALGGQRLIKCLPSSVPGSRIEILAESLQESTASLQVTADSVCYRFYPKCEVVP